nr:coat protein [Nigrospora chinensis victorivirus 1]
MASVGPNHFLAGVIARPLGGRIASNDRFRRYRTVVRTSAVVGGVEDSRTTSIYYEVGRAVSTAGAALAAHGDNAHLVEASYPTNSILVEDFVGMAKKYSNFSANFQYSSLAGVAERLARGLAACSVFEGVTSTALRGNQVLAVHALATYDGPVNSLTDTVFLPRLVNDSLTGDVFSILANAVAGEGSSIATDVIELDANTRQPIIPETDPLSTPGAIVDALRVIGSNMVASDQGPLFSLAVTRGIHRVLSLVGHSDEGGVLRDLLRCGGFSPPFGGIHFGTETYVGIPQLQFNSAVGTAAYVDSIALTTAAAACHADPGVEYDGEWFPTFYDGTTMGDRTMRPGDSEPGTAGHSLRNRSQLLANQQLFWAPYINALAKIFGATGSSTLSERFSCAASYGLSNDSRHLRYPSIAPWYWVEPTGLIPHDFLGSRAEEEGFASYAYRDTARSKPAWDRMSLVGARDTTFSSYHLRMKGARTSWFLAHWGGHPENGLGATRVRQVDPNTIIHPGPCDEHPQIRDRVEADLPISSYLWTRGQSPFPAPGELLNLSVNWGVLFRHVTFTDDGDLNTEHLPAAHELADTTVTIQVGRPIGISTGASNSPDAGVKRARTRASIELAAARKRMRLYGRPDVGEMVTASSAPGGLGPRFVHDSHRGGTAGGVTGVANNRSAAPGHASASERQPDGQAARAVPHHQVLRYPDLPRQRPGGGGGGGGVIHPPNPAGSLNPPADDNTEPTAPTINAPADPSIPAAPGNGPTLE